MDARLCFLWARVLSVDGPDGRDHAPGLSFTDFLEAVARVAEKKRLPTDFQMDKVRAVSACSERVQ